LTKILLCNCSCGCLKAQLIGKY